MLIIPVKNPSTDSYGIYVQLSTKYPKDLFKVCDKYVLGIEIAHPDYCNKYPWFMMGNYKLNEDDLYSYGRILDVDSINFEDACSLIQIFNKKEL